MTTRRGFVKALGLCGLVANSRSVAAAQPAGRVFQIGYVGNADPALEASLVEGFRQGLRERGYTEGKDVVIHYRWAHGRSDLLPGNIAELIALKSNVLVTSGTPALFAARKATASIPIVMAAIGDAVAVGVVSNLARPGGNITGLSTLYPDLEGKRLEILRELVPSLKHLALLSNPTNPFTQIILKATRAAADTLRVPVQVYEVGKVEEFDRVFAAIAKAKPDAMAVLADRPFLVSNREQIIRFAARTKLPGTEPPRIRTLRTSFPVPIAWRVVCDIRRCYGLIA